MDSHHLKISELIKQLTRDKLFWLAILAGPFFWGSLYYSGTGLTGPGWVSANLVLFLQLALLYPLLEELVFRGLLQESLWKTHLANLSIYCISLPNIITSLLFTAFHFFSHSAAWAVAVIFPSLVFGYFRDRYRHVLPAVILHMFYNSGYFVLFGK